MQASPSMPSQIRTSPKAAGAIQPIRRKAVASSQRPSASHHARVCMEGGPSQASAAICRRIYRYSRSGTLYLLPTRYSFRGSFSLPAGACTAVPTAPYLEPTTTPHATHSSKYKELPIRYSAHPSPFARNRASKPAPPVKGPLQDHADDRSAELRIYIFEGVDFFDF